MIGPLLQMIAADQKVFLVIENYSGKKYNFRTSLGIWIDRIIVEYSKTRS